MTSCYEWHPLAGDVMLQLCSSTVRVRVCCVPCVQAVQMLFEQSQASFDPNTIMALLQQHPYHVDALLTMHELYRSGM